MPAPYMATAISNTFLRVAQRHGESLSHLKLQKLVYLAHGWHLVLKEAPLLTERVVVRPYGPAIDSLSKELSVWGDNPVVCRSLHFLPGAKAVELYVDRDDDFVHRLLQKIWDVYGSWSAIQLANFANGDDSPWQEARENGCCYIENGALARYFAQQQRIESDALPRSFDAGGEAVNIPNDVLEFCGKNGLSLAMSIKPACGSSGRRCVASISTADGNKVVFCEEWRPGAKSLSAVSDEGLAPAVAELAELVRISTYFKVAGADGQRIFK